MEIYVVCLFLIGLGLAGFGVIWTMVLSFTEHIFWGISYLALPLLGAWIFISAKWHLKPVRASVSIQFLGWIFMGASAIIVLLQNWDIQKVIARWHPQKTPPPPVTEVSADYGTEAIMSVNIPPPISPYYEPYLSLKSYTSRSQFKRYMEVGYLAFNAGDDHSALINFQHALKERPDNPYAIKAIENTQKRISDRNYTQSMNAGYQAFDRQKYTLAAGHFHNALKYRPQDPYALKALENLQRFPYGR